MLMANPTEYPEEIWGIEDPHITYVQELDQYAMAYTSFARGGPGVSLALTKDFRSFERFGVVMSPEDKDAALCRGCTARDYPAIELALNQHEIR
jgi:beta-1,2-mannobiose phosphorylase / 1,2-beta-oligomannan phosphorylase